MGCSRVFVLGLFVAATASVAQAADKDRILPTQGPTVTGTVSEMTPQEVVLRQGLVSRKFPVNEIAYIIFEAEPQKLSEARSAALKRHEYGPASTLLGKVDTDDLRRPEVKADYEFLKALIAARLALAGDGSKQEAGKHLVAFEKNNKLNYHYLEACEVLGDLLVSLGKYDQAGTYYEKLASAPWPEYKMRAGVLRGRSLLAQKKYKEAIAKFDEVLAQGQGVGGGESEREQTAATLSRATAVAGAGKPDEALQVIQQVIDQTPKESSEVLARAFNAQGTCFRLAGKNKEALLAFLHVDLLYASIAEQHAEALANLSTLWGEFNKAERGAAARKQLKELYPGSQWAQGL